MSTEQQTVASLKDEIVERGLYNDFKVLLAARNKQDLLDLFVCVDDAAKYAATISDQRLISFKKFSYGYRIIDRVMDRRIYCVNASGHKATGVELVQLYAEMKNFLKTLKTVTEKSNTETGLLNKTFNRVVVFHDACETQHFDLGGISLQEAIETYCYEFDLEDSDIENIQVLFFNESDLKRIEKKVTYKVLD